MIGELKLPKDFKNQLSALMLERKDLNKIDTYADLIYTYFRNTMFHGYRASGTYLQHNLPVIMEVNEGYTTINPYRFWDSFKSLFEEIFNDLVNKPNSSYRKQCNKYLEIILA